MTRCNTCQGNGEIITDWDRYLTGQPGDKGDEAVAECPDCDGTGEVPPSLEEAIDTLKLECGLRQWRFNLQWSEAENTYYGYADGQGQGEFLEVKRRYELLDCVIALTELVKQQPA